MFQFFKQRDTLSSFIGHAALIVFILLLGAYLYMDVYLGHATSHNESVRVPDLKGKSVQELEAFLEKNQLRYDITDSAYQASLPPNAVLFQYPYAGSEVKPQRLIHITVNQKNIPKLPMPNIFDRSLNNAKVVFQYSDLKLGNIIYTPSPYLDLVISASINGQPVHAGTRIEKGSVIDLYVGDGGRKADFAVGNLIGESYKRALLKINGWNLNLGQVTVPADVDTTGVELFVYKQKPSAGDSIRYGFPVNVWIAPRGYKEAE